MYKMPLFKIVETKTIYVESVHEFDAIIHSRANPDLACDKNEKIDEINIEDLPEGAIVHTESNNGK